MTQIKTDENLNTALNSLETLRVLGSMPDEVYHKTKDALHADVVKRLSNTNSTFLKNIDAKLALLKSHVGFLEEKNLLKEYDEFVAKGDYGIDEKLADYCQSFVSTAEYLKSKGESLPSSSLTELMTSRRFLQKT